MQTYLLDGIVIFLLIFTNGILAMTEIAIVSSNRTKIDVLAKTKPSARMVAELMDNPDSFFSTIQIGITVIGIISGAFSGQRFAEPLGNWLNASPWTQGYGNLIAFSFVIVLITYISIVLGELIPKHLAIKNPEKIATLFARPVCLLSQTTALFVFILDWSTKTILKIFHQTDVKEPSVTPEEINLFMKKGFKEGAIDAFEHKIFQKVLQFGDREAGVIMTPRIKLIHLDLTDNLYENIEKIIQNPHRYYPVFEGGFDNFKGILDTKDALSQQLQGKKFDIKSLIKEVPFVIEDSLGPDLLEQFKNHKAHVGVVIDEYGTVQGLITLTDLFETLVGTLPEFQQEKHYDIISREDGSWLCDGLTPIDEIEELLQLDIINTFEDNDFHTLAGFILILFKHIPKDGEIVIWNEFKFEIMDMDGTRIDKILIQKP